MRVEVEPVGGPVDLHVDPRPRRHRSPCAAAARDAGRRPPAGRGRRRRRPRAAALTTSGQRGPDSTVLAQISQLAHDEHALRSSMGHGEAQPDDVARLRRIEEELDQCWDLLRQRRAQRETGGDPDQAHARSVSEVEGYLQ